MIWLKLRVKIIGAEEAIIKLLQPIGVIIEPIFEAKSESQWCGPFIVIMMLAKPIVFSHIDNRVNSAFQENPVLLVINL